MLLFLCRTGGRLAQLTFVVVSCVFLVLPSLTRRSKRNGPGCCSALLTPTSRRRVLSTVPLLFVPVAEPKLAGADEPSSSSASNRDGDGGPFQRDGVNWTGTAVKLMNVEAAVEAAWVDADTDTSSPSWPMARWPDPVLRHAASEGKILGNLGKPEHLSIKSSGSKMDLLGLLFL